jgi:NAD(P)-dependent dehydrogenase (short-subunit alcohol dehydrogenase family)
MMGTQSTTKDGLETMMQANHLGHFLLMKLMLEKGMLKTKGDGSKSSDEPSRVCILTSSTYLFAASTSGFDFVDPYCSNGKREYTLFGQYSMTKLANLLISKELARRYNTGGASETESALAVFAVHPGIVRTNVTSNMNWYYRLGNEMFAWIVKAIQKTAAEGAYSTVYTVAAPLAEIPFWRKGSYVVNCKEQAANDYVEGPNGSLDATRLWEWSEEQLLEGAKNGDNGKDSGEKKEQ